VTTFGIFFPFVKLTTNFVGGQQGVGFATPRPPPTKVGGFADINH